MLHYIILRRMQRLTYPSKQEVNLFKFKTENSQLLFTSAAPFYLKQTFIGHRPEFLILSVFFKSVFHHILVSFCYILLLFFCCDYKHPFLPVYLFSLYCQCNVNFNSTYSISTTPVIAYSSVRNNVLRH